MDKTQFDTFAQKLEVLERNVERLRDCEVIRQAMYRYARGVDRGDETLLEPAFHDDAYDDHGNFRGTKQDALAALAKSAKNEAVTASMHHIGNILIDLDGDFADVESYFIAYQRRVIDGRDFTRIRAGRYLDRFEKREGVWRVLNRKVIDDWSRLDEVISTAHEVSESNHHGTRSRTDPSYEVEGFLEAFKTMTDAIK